MVVDSSELYEDFTAAVAAVAEFASLPAHKFEYDSSREFKRGACNNYKERHIPNYFAEGGRFVY